MRIDVGWLSEEKRAVHIVFHAGWDWRDFEEHRKLAQALVNQVSHKVAAVMEFDKDANMLPNNALRNFGFAAETADSHVSEIVIVSPSQYWRVVIVLLKRLLPNSVLKHTHIVPSFQDALKLLNQLSPDSGAYE